MQVAGGRGAMRTRRGWSRRSRPAATTVSGVARRHGLSPQQLFGWRRQVKEAQAVVSKDDEPRFVPAVVDAAPSDTAGHLQRKTPRRQRDEPLAGTIEVAIDGVTVRIGPGAPAGHDRRGVAGFESRRVIGPTGAVRVMVATRPVDFRKGADGLAALVRESMAADPFSGAVYVFRAKARGPDQAGVLGRHGSVPVRQAAGGWHLPLAEDRRRRDPFVGRAIVGAARRAGLAACPCGA